MVYISSLDFLQYFIPVLFVLPLELVLKWAELRHFPLQKAFIVLHFLQNNIQRALHAIQDSFYLSGILWLNLSE